MMGILSGKEEICMRLWKEGESDSSIGRHFGVSAHTVMAWRCKAGLESNYSKLGLVDGAEEHRRREMHSSGMSDKQIAERTNRSVPTIHAWRKVRGLPVNNVKSLSKDDIDARLSMLRAGMTDHEIGRRLKRERCSIASWRSTRGLPSNVPKRSPRRGPSGDPTLDRIRHAVGRGLPQDIADDAVADIYLATLERRISVDGIETNARRFASRVRNEFANSFRTRSVDEVMSGTEDLRLIDTLVDDSAEDWLEEMGATVFYVQ